MILLISFSEVARIYSVSLVPGTQANFGYPCSEVLEIRSISEFFQFGNICIHLLVERPYSVNLNALDFQIGDAQSHSNNMPGNYHDIGGTKATGQKVRSVCLICLLLKSLGCSYTIASHPNLSWYS
jgi:hypothetical protein